jgi:DNA-binding Lrp family transcriptional regulator
MRQIADVLGVHESTIGRRLRVLENQKVPDCRI